MHRREKSAIQRHRREIVDDLFLEEDLLAKMMREKLFTTGMIDDIKSQRTMRDKTHRLLELLLKRGPEAFSKFIVILREDYLWLAERLEESYTARLGEEEIPDSARTPRPLQLSFPPTPRETYPKRLVSTSQSSRNVQDSYTRSSTVFFPENTEQIADELDGQTSREDLDNRQKADACISPIQTLLPSRRFIHTASSPFPLSRETSQNNYGDDEESDEEAADGDNTHHDAILQLSNPRDVIDAGIATEDSETTDTEDDYNETDEEKILAELFLKLYKINTENDTETGAGPEFGQITLAMVHEEIDKLVQRVDSAEMSLEQAYQKLGVQDTKIPIETHLQKLLESQDELAQQLEKEKREKDSMVNDMYYISQEMKRINNLKQRNAKLEVENKELKEELEKTKQEGQGRIDEIQKRLNELEREKAHATLQQQQHQLPLQTMRRRTTKSFLSPRRSQPLNIHQQSSFDMFPPRSKITYKKK